MPGSPMIGIGPALRKAREHRSKTIDEAARDTKIRPEYLQALERESFDGLMGDAYVRGFLRSYAQYLGLDPEKVLAAYSRSVGESEPADLPDPVKEADRPSSPLYPRNRTRSWLLAGIGAAAVIVLFMLSGFLSGSHTAPPPVALPSVLPSLLPTAPRIDLGLIAKHEIADVLVTADGVTAFSGTLYAQEGRTFQAVHQIEVTLPKGGVVRFKYMGEELGPLGSPDEPFSRIFYPPPSPTPSPGPGSDSGDGSPSPSPTPSSTSAMSPSAEPSEEVSP